MSGVSLSFAGLSNYAPATGGFEAMEEGWYPFVATDSELKPTANGNGQRLSITIKACGGDFNGMSFRQSYNVENSNPKAVEIGIGELLALANVTCGIQAFAQSQNTATLFNIPFYGRIVQRTSDQGYVSNELKNWKNQSEQVAILTRAEAAANKAAKPAAQPAAAPAQFQQAAPAQQFAAFQQPATAPVPQQAQAPVQPQQFGVPAGAPAQQAPAGQAPQQFAAPVEQQQQFQQAAPQQFQQQGGFQMPGQPAPQQVPQQQAAPQQQFQQPAAGQQFQQPPAQPAWGQPQ